MQFTDEKSPFTTLKQILKTWKAKDWMMLVVLILGMCVSGYGIWGLRQVSAQANHNLEAIQDTSQKADLAMASNEITLEVAGAVEKPGLVILPQGSRVGDAVSAAGGFQAKADKKILNQELNLARIVQDGEKLYIPFAGESITANPPNQPQKASQPTQSNPSAPLTPTSASSTSDKVSINSATISELDELDGIGQARAESIVQNRPYATIDELVTKKVLPQSTFDAIKNNIAI